MFTVCSMTAGTLGLAHKGTNSRSHYDFLQGLFCPFEKLSSLRATGDTRTNQAAPVTGLFENKAQNGCQVQIIS